MIKHACVWLLLLTACISKAQQLPVWNNDADSITTTDWLVKPVTAKATIYQSADEKDIIFYNGFVKRTFRLQPNLTCTEYKNMSNGQQLLRAVMPEAIVIINGTSYNVGGLYGQKEKAYLLPEWLDNFSANDSDFHFISYTISPLKPFLNWNSNAVWAMNKQQPTGKTISFLYRSKLTALKGIDVKVNYELYDGIPLIVKCISITNNQNNSIVY